jgi:adenylate cyclase
MGISTTFQLKKRSARLLIVDDDMATIQMVGAMLKQAGYQINVARDGVQALEVVSKSPPDLIISDIDMPNMGGIDFCRTLKSNPKSREIPVIFLSGNKDTEDIVRGFHAGAIDYVFKPFNSLELLTRLDTHLSLRETQVRLADVTQKVSRYVSPHIYDAIFSGKRDVLLETRRRPLTVYFSDIVSFTERTEAMGDEDLTSWLNSYCDRMAQICLRHGGTLDKFIGDAVMVFFGDPTSEGEQRDAVNCLRMAIEMNHSTEEWGVEIRTGINSGLCSVGNFGTQKQMNYTVIGNVVNAAARLQSASEPGRILISEGTYNLVRDDFWCEERGPVKVKGIQDEIMTYWVNG